jgi:hypothetical protein
VMEFVEVFAVDARIFGIDKEGDSLAKNISLLVEPEQGKVVNLATGLGKLSTMLRPNGDITSSGKTEISAEFLDSSFSGSGHVNRSVMENREVEMADESIDPPSIDESLALELARVPAQGPEPSAPVNASQRDNPSVWTMEIYEGDKVRLEVIDLPKDAGVTASGNWNIWNLLKSK